MKPLHPAAGAAVRTAAGILGAVSLGGFLFRGRILQPGRLEYQVLIVGLLCAFIVATARVRKPAWGVAIAVAFAAYQWASFSPQSFGRGIVQTLGGAHVAAGLVLAGQIFDRLGRMGLRVGKFLVLGPLVGGMLLAVTPLATLANRTVPDLSRLLIENLFLGMVIGNGVGIGIELIESLPSIGRVAAGRDPREASAETPAADAGDAAELAAGE